MSAPLALSIATVTDQNYGDHAERVRTVHAVVPGETVEDLVRRVFPALEAPFRSHNPGDVIEVQVLIGADGKVTGEGPPSTTPPW